MSYAPIIIIADVIFVDGIKNLSSTIPISIYLIYLKDYIFGMRQRKDRFYEDLLEEPILFETILQSFD